MPLTRKFTEAMQRLAKAKTRLADADEKFYAALLDQFFPEDRAKSKTPSPKASSSGKRSSPKQPPKL